jgi:glycosyltransferase involved in cell wall biosynthesis
MLDYGVVVPAYNAAETIEEALASVFEQTLPPAQVIVVDDGSTDDTVAVAARVSERVEIISQSNQGCGRASSVGAHNITTPVLAFLDADDIWLPGKMACQIALLEVAPEISLCHGAMRQFRHGSNDRVSGAIRPGPTRTTMALRTAVFREVGDIIDPPGNRGDLVDWLARFREAGYQEQGLDDVLALRRIIAGSLSYGRDQEKDLGYLKVAHLAMLRRRKAASEQ